MVYEKKNPREDMMCQGLVSLCDKYPGFVENKP